MEKWQKIEGYKPIYEVSDQGRVRSIARPTPSRGGSVYNRKEKYLSPGNVRGYLQVVLFAEDGTKKKESVHRLVATAFIPNPENRSEVDHINGDRTDNRAENLRWATRKENCNNPVSINRWQKRKGELSRNKRGIRAYTLDGKLVGEWPTITMAAKETGTGRVGISAVARGKRKTTNNLIWEYYG